jgi:hypothetical protein
MPVFPRGPDLYTHSLGRQTLLTTEAKLRRLDLQLLAMIADARKRLDSRGIPTEDKILLSGFSASAMFATRFAAVHPNSVRAVVAGGVNGFVILPIAERNGTPLPFPIGVSDFPEVVGHAFDVESWRRVPQFLFMGAKDDNDAVQFDDAYPPPERGLVYQLVGETMLPDRWETVQRIYAEADAPAVFKTYAHIGHGTDGRIEKELVEFFRKACADE